MVTNNHRSTNQVVFRVNQMSDEVVRAATDRGDVLEFPRHFSGYEVHETLGTGSYSVVVSVKDIAHDEEYAAKVMRRPQAHTEDMRLLERELRLGESVSCPYLVTCMNVVYIGSIIIVVMEKGHGKDLLSLIMEKPSVVAENWRSIFRQMCLGVQYLHDCGLAHRDLKPDNVLVDSDFGCKLCDYGLMCEVKQSVMSTTKCGTLPYMSPEMIYDDGYSGKAADVWALGIVLYVMVTGCIPWKSHGNIQMCQEIAEGVTETETLTSCQREIVLRCCEVDPEMRPTIEQVLGMSFVRTSSNVQVVVPVSMRGMRKKKESRTLIVRPKVMKPKGVAMNVSIGSKIGRAHV